MLCTVICTRIISHFPESHSLFSFDIQGCHWSPSQLDLTACSQVSPDQPAHPHLSFLSQTADKFLFHTGNSCCWSPCLKLRMTLHAALLNVILFLSPRSTKSSKFLSYDNLILLHIDNTSQLCVNPAQLPCTHPNPAHRAGSIQQAQAWSQGSKNTNLSPSWWLSLNTSLHSDNFICMQLLYLFLSQLLFHLSFLILNHHLHFKQ